MKTVKPGDKVLRIGVLMDLQPAVVIGCNDAEMIALLETHKGRIEKVHYCDIVVEVHQKRLT